MRMKLSISFLVLCVGWCQGDGECWPDFGRFPDNWSANSIGDWGEVYSWEACGRLCKDHPTCVFWAWNTPLNECATKNGKKCNICHMWSKTPTTSRNADWIAGPQKCYRSKSC